MDDELQQLEAELKDLRPASVPSALTKRIGAGLRETRSAGVSRWWLAAALPAAAAVAFGLVQVFRAPGTGVPLPDPQGAAAAADPAPLKPVAAEKLLVSATDEGLVTLSDGTTARRERFQFVDTITWRNAHTKASLTWTVPREEVRVVPVVWQ